VIQGWRRAVARLGIRSRRALPGAARTLEALVAEGFVAIDVETTGLDPRRDVLVSVAAVPFVGGLPAPGFTSLVAPGRPIPASATAVHGLTDRDVEGAPAAGIVVAQLDARCADRVLVGHDIAFDLAVLGAARAARATTPAAILAIDTRHLFRALHGGRSDSRLEIVAARLGVSTDGRHTAEGDARMAGRVLIALLPALRARGVRTVADLLRLQRTAPRYD
jgi:DNA polymerase-3 subunit epsilon